jgi:hypothetical protein
VTGRSGRGTPRQTIRIDEDLWIRFGDLAASQGLDRSTVLRQFIRWYVRLPDGAIPRRPS